MTQPFQKTVEERIGADGLALVERRFGSHSALFAAIDYWTQWLDQLDLDGKRALELDCQRWENEGGAC